MLAQLLQKTASAMNPAGSSGPACDTPVQVLISTSPYVRLAKAPGTPNAAPAALSGPATFALAIPSVAVHPEDLSWANPAPAGSCDAALGGLAASAASTRAEQKGNKRSYVSGQSRQQCPRQVHSALRNAGFNTNVYMPWMPAASCWPAPFAFAHPRLLCAHPRLLLGRNPC